MSLKAELETWAAALELYDANDFDGALDLFQDIADSSKILFNMGLIYATTGEHEMAVEKFQEAVGLDQYLAVAYFQCGVSNFLLGNYDLAGKDFDAAFNYLRGNENIMYEQLGLKFKLYCAEVLFNRGLAHIYLGDAQRGLADMDKARQHKVTDDHAVIDDAIADRGEGYTVFSIPVGVLYRPPESKMRNVKTKDYLGKAKLVAAADAGDAFTSFTGSTRLKQGITPGAQFVEPESQAAQLTRSKTMAAAKKIQLDVASEGTRVGGALGRAKTLAAARANGGGGSGAVAFADLPRVTLSDGPAPAPAPAPEPARAPVARAASTSGARGPPLRGLSVRKPSTGTTSAPAPPMPEAQDDVAARVERLRMNDLAVGGGRDARGPPSAGGLPYRDAASPEQGGTRGLNVRKAASPRQPVESNFYDDYLDSYTREEDEMLPLPADDRVTAWARSGPSPGAGAGGRPTPPGSYAPSSYAPSSAGGMRRKVTRRGTQARSRAMSYYEEEEGYESGEMDEPMYELVKVRVKVHYQDDVRGMAIDPTMSFGEFIAKVHDKFDVPRGSLGLKFKDEDGGKVSLRDESDFELAIETARESAKGKPEGKLEVWCTDR